MESENNRILKPKFKPNTDYEKGMLRRCNTDLHLKSHELVNQSDFAKEMSELKDFMTREFNKLNNIILKQNEEILKTQADNAVLLKQLYKNRLPNTGLLIIKDEEGLESLEKDIEENEEEFVAVMRKLFTPGGLKKNFHKLFGEKLILDFNYDGVSGKNALKNYKNITRVLFGALMEDGYTEAEFVKNIRHSFNAHKNKYFKNLCIKKAKEKDNNEFNKKV